MESLRIRSVRESDLDELRELHDLLFPIKYGEAFFRNMVQGIGPNGRPLTIRIAVDTNCSAIAGFIIAQYVTCGDCEDEGLCESAADTVLYVMTVGTRPEYARCGVGSALLNAIKADAQTQPGCCAVYLHVIHYNAAAMSFYEKHGFTRLRHLRQFYSIGDSHHNAYLYILYINGYRLPLLSRILERASTAVTSAVAFLGSYCFGWRRNEKDITS